MSRTDEASADSDYSPIFPHDGRIPKEFRAPIQQSATSRDNPGDMTGHETLYKPKLADNTATDNQKKPDTRNNEGNETLAHPSPGPQGHTHRFKENPEPTARSLTKEAPLSNQIQELVDRDANKAGLCVICSCTNPRYAEPIESCTAPQKMHVCFGTELGFSTVRVQSVMSAQDLNNLLRELSNLRIPEACGGDFRFLFYFFGHGNEKEICLADRNFERSCIISELQRMSPALFKIIIFDSCRTSLSKPVQETASIQGLPAEGRSSQWETKEQYPYADCVNTLVIYATDNNSKAYYIDDNSKSYPIDSGEHGEMKGCGLVTYFFTTLAPLMNQPLPAVLAEVRKSVDKFIKEQASLQTESRLRPQVLVYEDLLMGNVNLLAESKGTKRVTPEIIPPVVPSVLFSTIQWVFRLNVDNRIQTFRVTCRDEEGKSIKVKEKLTLKNVAKFSNNPLKPKTTYHVKVVAVYKDGFEAESEETSFTTKERCPPQDISITPTFLGSSKAMVKWHFADQDLHLSEFRVQVDGGENTVLSASVREAKIQGLHPSAINPVTVTAIYKDGVKTECCLNYKNDRLECATISSLCLTKLAPLTVDLKWEMKSREDQLPQHHFKVKANDEIMVDGCVETHAKLSLNPGTQYSLTIETCYIDGTGSFSKEYQYTTPTEDDMKPGIELSEEKRNSVAVKVSDPALFQRRTEFHAEDINLEISFRVKRTPVGDSDSSERYKSHTIQRETTSNHDPVSSLTTYQSTLAGLIAGTPYKVKCEMDCSSGDTLTNEKEFTSADPSCMQRTCYSPRSMLFFCLLCLMVFGVFTFTYLPYVKHLRGHQGSSTHLALSAAAVQCGSGNSLHYKGINVQGSLKSGDALQGTFSAWLVRRNKLKLYSKQIGPIPDGYLLRDDRYALLNGWSTYTWEGSAISGFCCVQNQNNKEQTATLHIFVTDEDVKRYRDESNAKNYIFSESITIPTNEKHCFQKWGMDKPLEVDKSAYHFFVLHVSADDMNFTSEISLLQKYVNTSDYKKPKYFSYNNHTYLPFPRGFKDPTDYIVICRAPYYITSSIDINKPDVWSLHVCSWGSPYGWRVVFPVVSAISGACFLMVLYITIASIVLCVMWLKQKKSSHKQNNNNRCILLCNCSFLQKHNNFERLGSRDSDSV